MPVARKKSTKTATTTAPVVEAVAELIKPVMPVVYPKLKIVECSTTSERGPLTVEMMKKFMGWETEEQYQARMVRENLESKPEHWLFGDTGPRRADNGAFQPIHCLDIKKRKVVCWNNAGNRNFDEKWSEALKYTTLRGNWVGPHTVPGETVNGETIRISRYGRVLSGQHQMTGAILGDEELQDAREKAFDDQEVSKYPFWDGHEHLFIETIVITGLSEDERVLQSIDYVKPRTLADMLYTMVLFREHTPKERQELTKMLAAAADLLWDRTNTKGYKTHTEMAQFLDRHKRLLDCVAHLFTENASRGADEGRNISKLKIMSGHAAALMYLMACSGDKTDGDDYRNGCPPSERNLDWGYWNKARDFWTNLARATDHGYRELGFIPLRVALLDLLNSSPTNPINIGLGGRTSEKFAIIARAWERWKEHPANAGPAFDDNDRKKDGCLALTYSDVGPPKLSVDGSMVTPGKQLPAGQWRLIDTSDLGGIDYPTDNARVVDTAPHTSDPDEGAIARMREEALARRKAEADAKAAKTKGKKVSR